MASTIKTTRFGSYRGGKSRQITYPEFIQITEGKDRPIFIVEKILLPDFGDNHWGGFVIRENSTRVISKYRRQ